MFLTKLRLTWVNNSDSMLDYVSDFIQCLSFTSYFTHYAVDTTYF
jgi:hypothetical protein